MRKKILRLFKKQYIAYLLFVFIAFSIFGEMYHFLILSNQKTMIIRLNYPGAEEGLNPDGSRFVISEMTNDEILNNAKKGLGIEKKSNNTLRTRLFVTTKFSQKAMDEVLSDIRSGMRGSYVPTTFHVYYSQKNKLGKNESHEFMAALGKAYKDYFYANHAENNSVLKFDMDIEDFEAYDYSEIYTILYNKADQMLSLMKTHQDENRGFKTDSNLNFSSLNDELSNFKDVKLEKFNAFIVQNNVSKNRSAYINKMSYLINKNMINFNKKSNSSEIAKTAVNKYDPQIIAVAFVPSVDSTNSYYMSRTKTGIDDLARNSYADGMEAAVISKKLDDYNNKFTKMTDASDTDPQVIANTDEYLKSILKDFRKLSKNIVKLDNEYLEYKTENYITYTVDEKSKIINVKIMIKFAIFGIFLALLMIVYIEFFHGVVAEKTQKLKKTLKAVKERKERRRSK